MGAGDPDQNRVLEPPLLYRLAQCPRRRRRDTDRLGHVEARNALKSPGHLVTRRARDRIGMVEAGPPGLADDLPRGPERERADIGVADMVEERAWTKLGRVLLPRLQIDQLRREALPRQMGHDIGRAGEVEAEAAAVIDDADLRLVIVGEAEQNVQLHALFLWRNSARERCGDKRLLHGSPGMGELCRPSFPETTC